MLLFYSKKSIKRNKCNVEQALRVRWLTTGCLLRAQSFRTSSITHYHISELPHIRSEAAPLLSHRRRWGWRRSPGSPRGKWCIRRCRWPRRPGAARRKWWWCPPESASAASRRHSWTPRGPCRAAPQTRPVRDWRWPRSAWCRWPASARSPVWRRTDGKSWSVSQHDARMAARADWTDSHHFHFSFLQLLSAFFSSLFYPELSTITQWFVAYVNFSYCFQAQKQL